MSSICMSWLGVEASFGSGATTGLEPVNPLPRLSLSKIRKDLVALLILDTYSRFLVDRSVCICPHVLRICSKAGYSNRPPSRFSWRTSPDAHGVFVRDKSEETVFAPTLLHSQRGHRHRNVKRLGGNSHTALAGIWRICTTRSLALATRCPKHEAQRPERRSRALRRYGLDEIRSSLLVRAAKRRTNRLPGDQPKTASQLRGCQRRNAGDTVYMLRPTSFEGGHHRLL